MVSAHLILVANESGFCRLAAPGLCCEDQMVVRRGIYMEKSHRTDLYLGVQFSSNPDQCGRFCRRLVCLEPGKDSTCQNHCHCFVYSGTGHYIFSLARFLFSLLLFGPEIIRPGLTSFSNLGPWGITFLTAYVIMLSYGAFFFYGLFINPNQLKRTAAGITSLPYLKRWKRQAIELGNNFILASKELKAQNRRFHLKVFGATAAAWTFKFTLINCIIIALVSVLDTGFLSQLKLYSRLEAMFIIMAFSPTPGGSGFAEFVFGGFLSDLCTQRHCPGSGLCMAPVYLLQLPAGRCYHHSSLAEQADIRSYPGDGL
jgi:hypothetical protein